MEAVAAALIGLVAGWVAAKVQAKSAKEARPDALAVRLMEAQFKAYDELVQAIFEMNERLGDAEMNGESSMYEVMNPKDDSPNALVAWRWKYIHLAHRDVLEALKEWESALHVYFVATVSTHDEDATDGDRWALERAHEARYETHRALIESLRTAMHVDSLGNVMAKMLEGPKPQRPALPEAA